MKGNLIGVGVGPGDPELITIKAAGIIKRAKVIAYPAPDSGVSFARSIAQDYITPGVIEIPMIVPMRPERFQAQSVYDAAASVIKDHLDAQKDVVVLCEGDPLFFGSFMYLLARLKKDYPAIIVPGVSSLGAVSAAAKVSLCARNEVMSVVPATLDEAELEDRLSGSGAFAIVKIGRHLDKMRAVLQRLKLVERAYYVSHASLPQQRVSALSEAPEKAPYFSMILIPGTDAHAQL